MELAQGFPVRTCYNGDSVVGHVQAMGDDVRQLPLAIRAALMAVAAIGLAAALRFLFVEQPELTWACQSLTPPWWCPLRLAAIATVRFGLLGFMALAAGLLALWRGRLFYALCAIVCGAAGLILYVPEPAAGGLLLGALSMLRR